MLQRQRQFALQSRMRRLQLERALQTRARCIVIAPHPRHQRQSDQRHPMGGMRLRHEPAFCFRLIEIGKLAQCRGEIEPDDGIVRTMLNGSSQQAECAREVAGLLPHRGKPHEGLDI